LLHGSNRWAKANQWVGFFLSPANQNERRGDAHKEMPFPLAHPAAVLPLRRHCPRCLSFPGLVIGSLSPDVGYCFGNGNYSHRFFPGSFAFCLPVGLLMLLVFYGIRLPVVQILPPRLSQVFLPQCRRPVEPKFLIVLSVLIGAWTHLFLDSLSHEDGWLVQHLPFLRISVPLLWRTSFKGYDLLYAGFTLFGVAWLAVCYWRWLEFAAGSTNRTHQRIKWIYAVAFGASILCVAITCRGEHPYLGTFPFGIIFVALLSGFLVVTARMVTKTGRSNF
jgi:hypothetical protein